MRISKPWNKNDSVLACIKFPANTGVPSFTAKCELCHTQVHVSYTGYAAAQEGAKKRDGRTIIACIHCVSGNIDDETEIGFTDEQRQQVEKITGYKISEEEFKETLESIRAGLKRKYGQA